MMSATKRILRGEVGQLFNFAKAKSLCASLSFSLLILFLDPIAYLFFTFIFCTCVPSECTGWRELSQFVPYHVFSYIHRDELFPVVNREGLSYKIRRNHGSS